MGVADNLDNRTGILRDLVMWTSGGQRKHNGSNRLKCTSGTLRLKHLQGRDAVSWRVILM